MRVERVSSPSKTYAWVYHRVFGPAFMDAAGSSWWINDTSETGTLDFRILYEPKTVIANSDRFDEVWGR